MSLMEPWPTGFLYSYPCVRVILSGLILLEALAGCGGKRDGFRSESPLAKPELSTMRPRKGFPGTEVILEGKHLAQPVEISCNGKSLSPNRFEVQGNTRILAQIPDDVEGDALLSVGNSAGSSLEVFTVRPSHREVLRQPFVPVYSVLDNVRMLDFPTYRRTNHYPKMQLPIAPRLEVYPARGLGEMFPPASLATTCLLNLRLPPSFHELLPASVQTLLQDQGIPSFNVEILCVSQHDSGDGKNHVFQPYDWIDPEAPATGSPPTSTTVRVALRDQAPDIHFAGHGPSDLLEETLSVHPKDAPEPTVNSPLDDLAITGLNSHTSTAFWSITIFRGRAAATLHLLLSDRDNAVLEHEAGLADNFYQLLRGMQASPVLNQSHPYRKIQALFRPRLAGYGRKVEGQDPERWTFLHNGTGLARTTAVTVGDLPVESFKALSDGLLQVSVPKGMRGDLQVTTDLGESASVPLIPAAAE